MDIEYRLKKIGYKLDGLFVDMPVERDLAWRCVKYILENHDFGDVDGPDTVSNVVIDILDDAGELTGISGAGLLRGKYNNIEFAEDLTQDLRSRSMPNEVQQARQIADALTQAAKAFRQIASANYIRCTLGMLSQGQ
mgnify:CR=1 FL=1